MRPNRPLPPPRKPDVLYRTAEETAARAAAETGDATPPPSPLVKLAPDRKRVEQLRAAGKSLAGEGESEALEVWQLLAAVGYPVPPLSEVTTIAGLVNGLVSRGWFPVMTYLAKALPGNLYVQCDPETREPVRVGIVSSLERDTKDDQPRRDYFIDAFAPGGARKVKIGEVDGWLLAPGSCRTCANRKQPEGGGAVAEAEPEAATE
jgi:hypothetical protein